MKINCIIIDDEPLAINVLKSYCDDLSNINVLGVYRNPIDAIQVINSHQTDLVFTDIDMPQINGIDFIKSLDYKPLFIFTTAYPEYAIEGFELNAVDYLVKPIPFARFLKAVSRVVEIIDLKTNRSNNIVPSDGTLSNVNEFIFVKSNYENVKINVNNIMYVQGLKDYLKIYIDGVRPILTLMSFKDIETKISDSNFIRVHKSFIVNINKINSIQKNKILIDNTRIPIGVNFKDSVMTRLGI